MVKTYIRAPNWTTLPPPKGPLALGHLLSNLEDFSSENQQDLIPIPKVNVHTGDGVVLELGRAMNGEAGIFGKFLAQAAIGLNLFAQNREEQTTKLSFAHLDTMSFNPDGEYIRKVMALKAAEDYMQKHNHKKPLYLVTGLKVGRQGSVITSESTTRGGNFQAGISMPQVPVQAGPHGSYGSTSSTGMSCANGSDFIVAFQVRKIYYVRGQLNHEVYKKNGEFHSQTGSSTSCGPGEPLDLQVTEGVSVTDFPNATEIQREKGDDITWIVPVN